MKIAYLGQMADVATENGISKKIRAQIGHWTRAGHAVRYFSLVPTNRVWSGFAPVQTELVTRGRVLQRLLRSLALARRIALWGPEVIYFRYAYHSPGLPRLFRRIPTVAEINSYDLAEYPLTLSRAKVIYHERTRGRVLRAVSGFISVTHELGQRFSSFAKPLEVIANGIDLDAFSCAPAPPPGPARLFFIGTPGSPWHGLERMAELARLFPEITIDVVGWTFERWRSLEPNPPAAPPNLRFHGEQPREVYEGRLREATAALGTLALFRNQMGEACPLKVREYLACGLPVIAGYRDTDVPEGADYFLQLPNDATSLAPHRERIAEFLNYWSKRRVSRSAIAHLDTAVKEQRRLQFLQQIASTHSRLQS